MNVLAKVESLDARALGGTYSIEILEVVSRRTKSLFDTPSLHKIVRQLVNKSDGNPEDQIISLVNAGFLKADFSVDSRGVKNIELTDAGWDAIGQQKPLWIGE